jgi:signal recognition particle receptor subunit beta
MVQFNFTERTIKAKLVYYGPAQSGKTTNLEQVHRLTDPGGTNRLISLNTGQDRTLFFDLLPLSLGAVAGYDIQVQLYTVPGQVQYNATRRVVLAGADAVVFVVDSRRPLLPETSASFENMKVNLLANRLVPEKVPLVVQYNKRDLPDAAPLVELDRVLNPWGRPTREAVASRGQGVLETLMAAMQEMLLAIAQKYTLKDKGLEPASVPSMVAAAFAQIQEAASRAAASGASVGRRVVVTSPTDALPTVAPAPGTGGSVVSEELLQRAIRANVDLAEALAGLVREMNLGLASILSHAELLLVYREEAREKRAAAARNIHGEALRLRDLVQQLGEAARGAPPPAAPAVAAVSAVAATPAPRGAVSAPRAGSAPEGGGVEGLLRRALATVQPALDERGLSARVRVPPACALPSAPSAAVEAVLSGALTAAAAASAPRTVITVRCELKPVLVRDAAGEVRQDFLMMAVGHEGTFTAEAQQKAMEGGGDGPLGAAARGLKNAGGFVRFAPLPGGAAEARLFFPMS